jgi:hypothetical protein
VVCVYSDFIVFGSVARQAITCPLWPVPGERRVRMLTNPWVHPSTSMIRRAVGPSVRFPTDISHGEDQVFFMQLFDCGSFLHVPEPLIEYRKSGNQQTAQRGHGVRVVGELWNWVKEHPEALASAEVELARNVFAQNLIVRHDHAFWCGDWEVVQRTRALYRDVAPPSAALPALFERGFPSPAMRLAYRAWNATLDAMPQRLRRMVVQISRRSINRIKRAGLAKPSESEVQPETKQPESR